MTDWIRREAVCLWYYLDIQIRQIVLGWKRFLLYILYILVFSWITGMAVNLFIGL